jgi:hypothetical protein
VRFVVNFLEFVLRAFVVKIYLQCDLCGWESMTTPMCLSKFSCVAPAVPSQRCQFFARLVKAGSMARLKKRAMRWRIIGL